MDGSKVIPLPDLCPLKELGAEQAGPEEQGKKSKDSDQQCVLQSARELPANLALGFAKWALPMNGEKPELVQQILGESVMSNSEKLKLRLLGVREDFQRFDGDTGSSEVQVAMLTERIANIAEHMRANHKDYNTKRGLQVMLNQRRKLLQYLRRSDFEAYTVTLVRLGLKDNYVKQDRLMARQTAYAGGKDKKNKKRRK